MTGPVQKVYGTGGGFGFGGSTLFGGGGSGCSIGGGIGFGGGGAWKLSA